MVDDVFNTILGSAHMMPLNLVLAVLTTLALLQTQSRHELQCINNGTYRDVQLQA